jgi:hypothetical protein
VLTPPRALRRSTGLAVPWRVDVEELTPQTLRAAIDDPSVDVLVEFFGASCARCTEFEQQYRTVRTTQLRAQAWAERAVRRRWAHAWAGRRRGASAASTCTRTGS